MFPGIEYIKTCLNGLRSRIDNLAKEMVASKADWNQNDPDALDYVKGRTHYEANGKVVQLPSKFLPSPTSNTVGAIKADSAKTTDIQPVRLGTDGKLYSSGVPIFTTSGNGKAYTANVPEITELVNGMLVVMIPHVQSIADSQTLNINGLGAYPIRRFDSATNSSIRKPYYQNWLKDNVPVLLIYWSGYWFACSFTKPNAYDLNGITSVVNGGTGRQTLSKGSYIIGNGLSSVQQKTPSEVLADIGAIPVPQTASVGQTVAVKAVDENGKPTEWEPVTLPEKMPNPNALTFTGAVSGSYDGSAPLSVEIPAGGGTVEDLPVLQSFTIEDDQTNIIEFTNLQNLTEFEVEISWIWSSTTGVSGIALWLEAGFGVWRNQTPILNNGMNRNMTSKIVFKGKRLSNTVNNIAIIGGVTGSYSSSCVTRISESETVDYIGLKLTTSDVFFVNGTTVILRGR